jgi:F-type H+-transporting ATPase subunit delta
VRGETIARNYAEALFEVADKEGELVVYGEGIEMVARLLDENRDFRALLETPRVPAAEKKAVLRRVLGGVVRPPLLNFLLLTIDKRRQRLLRDIARAYHELVDERLNRTRVEVTVARPQEEAVMARLSDALSRLLGKTAVPHLRVKPEILGGVIVRAGDTIYDGSLRRRLDRMRRQLLSAELPSSAELRVNPTGT